MSDPYESDPSASPRRRGYVHTMERNGEVRNLPPGARECPIWYDIDLDKITPNQVKVGGYWLGVDPQQRKFRKETGAKMEELHEELDKILNQEGTGLMAWCRKFHGVEDGMGVKDGMYRELQKRRDLVMDEVRARGDADLEQHFSEEPKRYGCDPEGCLVFSFDQTLDIARKPYRKYFPTKNLRITDFIAPDEEPQGKGKDKEQTAASPGEVQDITSTLKSITDVSAWLEAHKDVARFLNPVTDLEAPGYSQKILQPMSVRTLRDAKYQNNIQFIRSLRLIFDNCRLYNGPSHWLVRTANKIEAELLDLLRNSPEFASALVSLSKSHTTA